MEVRGDGEGRDRCVKGREGVSRRTRNVEWRGGGGGGVRHLGGVMVTSVNLVELRIHKVG